MIQDIAPHRYDVAYRKQEARDQDIILLYQNDRLLCRMDEHTIAYPSVKEVAKVFPEVYQKAKYLFCIDDTVYFDLGKHVIDAFLDFKYLPKEILRSAKPVWKAYAGITGFQIHKWYTQNRYCGGCGKQLAAAGGERALKCPGCGALQYPRINPSVIVGITDGNRILMTKYADGHSSYKKYALVAGYVEVGESLEDTVRREVMEEVGLRVKNIRYYKSQPWSFTDALLVGFFCDADGSTEIAMDEEELSEAVWFEKEHIPAERSEADISLTGEMIEAFRDGQV